MFMNQPAHQQRRNLPELLLKLAKPVPLCQDHIVTRRNDSLQYLTGNAVDFVLYDSYSCYLIGFLLDREISSTVRSYYEYLHTGFFLFFKC